MSNRIITQRARKYAAAIGITNPETGEAYQLTDSEKLVFGVKNSKETSTYIFRKELTTSDYDDTSGGYVLQLTTAEMNIAYGLYYYDVALRRSNGELETIIPLTEFEVTPSVVRQEAS
jgi:hypothetical protein